MSELARYRSEFFGRLREVLGDRADIRIVGDRFVFQSEVLFPSGRRRPWKTAARAADKLAQTLIESRRRFPTEVNWVLRVDGHTDRADPHRRIPHQLGIVDGARDGGACNI